MMKRHLALLFACTLAPAGVTLAQPAEQSEPYDIQVYFGALKLDDQTAQWSEISDPAVEVDFDTLPVFGIESEYVLHEGWVHVGLNPGGSIAWQNDGTRFAGSIGSGGGNLVVELDNSMFLAEVHLGGFVRGRLHEKITTYAAAGPMFLYGSHEVEDQTISGGASAPALSQDSASDFNMGYYARAGIDFEIRRSQHLGFGLRYYSVEMDFDDTIGNIDLEGPQWVFSFRQQL
ncbi:MAG: hypothetical protein NXI15_10565 [Gammaproteobacteria bacterium]|nr:hypothetical protein [Gammaproteobacteria bacterium]